VIDPILSFDMIQYRADEAIENIDPSFSAMLKVTIGDTEYPIIAGQTEGVSIKHEYALEDDFSDGILLEAMTLRGAGAAASLDQGDFKCLFIQIQVMMYSTLCKNLKVHMT